jgi:CRP/FNR family transcriptional regulator
MRMAHAFDGDGVVATPPSHRGERRGKAERAGSDARGEPTERPGFALTAVEDLLTGAQQLRQAFLQTPMRFAGRDASLARVGDPEPAIFLLHSGFAYRSCRLPDGRRTILEILVPGDITGLDHVVLASPIADITAADRLSYRALGGAAVRALMAEQSIAMHILALIAEARWRGDRLAASLGRLDAHARICLMLLDIYERLHRREMVNRPSFNLPFTQEQIADHLGLTLVHVNRTLRRLREERLVLVDRQVVIITDLDRLRDAVQGSGPSIDLPEPSAPIVEAVSGTMTPFAP